MKILFVTFNDVNNGYYGGSKGSTRNYIGLQTIGSVDVYKMKKISNLSSSLSLLEGFIPPARKKDLSKLLTIVNDYDLIFIDDSTEGKFVKYISKTHKHVIVFFHNCEYDFLKVRFANKKTLKSLVYGYMTKKGERESLEYCANCIALSSRDQHRLNELYGKTTKYILPLGLKDEAGESHEPESVPYCLLFGSLMESNIEAYEWFSKKVSPYLKCKTVIAGKGFEKYKVWETNKVKVLGFVENLNELYYNAACVAIPLFHGAGMKIKTSEAMMFGRYIFGSKEAFSGYNVDFIKIGGLCKTDRDYIAGINSLLEQKMFFNKYSRQQFEEHYSLDSSNRTLKKIIDEVMSDKK